MQLDLHQTCLPPDNNYGDNESDIFPTQFHGLGTAQVCMLVMVSGNCESCFPCLNMYSVMTLFVLSSGVTNVIPLPRSHNR
jgi:hypothetical protein